MNPVISRFLHYSWPVERFFAPLEPFVTLRAVAGASTSATDAAFRWTATGTLCAVAFVAGDVTNRCWPLIITCVARVNLGFLTTTWRPSTAGTPIAAIGTLLIPPGSLDAISSRPLYVAGVVGRIVSETEQEAPAGR